MELNLFFSKLVTQLQLGSLLSDAVRVHGGFIHTMYRLDTPTGAYAVKLLNPNVMKRPEAFNNYCESDRLEGILDENDIPIVPSLAFADRKMQELDGQYFYVYEWYDGKTIKSKEITTLHCRKISKVLSRIHHIDMRKESCQRKPMDIAWDNYIELAKGQSELIYHLLHENRALLCESQSNGNAAIVNLPDALSICHNDMDSKNVLWLGDDFKLIDLECLGYANPYLELFELALCWSGYAEYHMDIDLFGAFICKYFDEAPKPDIDWEIIYDSNYGRLEWLEYNLKRALLIECSTPEEQELGISQVKETIAQAIYYKKIQATLLRCLSEIFT